MRAFGIDMQGPFKSEILPSLPEWTTEDEGRELYISGARYYGDSTGWITFAEAFPSGTVMIFGNNAAPVGWTRKSDWQDNSMICYKASGSLSTGGSADAKAAHTHTGPSHAHSMQSHTHSMQNHTHTGGSHTHTLAHTHTGPLHAHTMAHTHSHYHSLTTGGSAVEGGGIFHQATDTDATGSSAANTGNDGNSATSAASVADTGSASATTGTPSTNNTTGPSNDTTTSSGTGDTGSNTAPYYQEVISAIKD